MFRIFFMRYFFISLFVMYELSSDSIIKDAKAK